MIELYFCNFSHLSQELSKFLSIFSRSFAEIFGNNDISFFEHLCQSQNSFSICGLKEMSIQKLYMKSVYWVCIIPQVVSGLEMFTHLNSFLLIFQNLHYCLVLSPFPFKKRQLVSTKGKFFPESVIRFSNLQISKKKYSKKLSWTWNLNFKLRIVFWNIFFLRFGDLKNESHFLNKSNL